jgi:hypothetical protein
MWNEKRHTGRRGKKCRMYYEERERERDHWHMWNGCSEMRERERKERGEIPNEDGREIRWMKEIWKWRERIEKEKGGDTKNIFLEPYFYVCNQESESP